jgi:hypothetical protein
MPDYGLGLVQPSMINQQLAQGVQTGIGLGEARVAAMDRQLLLERQAQADAAAKAEREAAIASQQAFAAEGKAVAEGGFQPQEVYKLYAKNPGVAKHYLDVLGKMNEDTKKNNMRNAASISAAILKSPEDGAALAEKLADAAANTPGQEKEAEALRTLAGQIRDNPGGAALQTSMFLAAAAGDEKEFVNLMNGVAAAQPSLDEANAKAGQAQAEQKIKDIQAETERDTRLEAILSSKEQRQMWKNQTGLAWARLKLDRDKFNQEVDEALIARTEGKPLTPDAFKHIAEKGVAAVASHGIADEAAALADEIETAGGSGGMDAAATKKYNEIFGSEDPKKNSLYARYETLKSKGIYRDIGPGTKTDDDYAAFERGWPGANANPKYKAAFLRGMAKAARFAASVENAQADYVSQNGDPSNAKRNLVVGGVPIPAGTTYADAVKRVSQGATITANGLDQ